jgi:hypothetical protein
MSECVYSVFVFSCVWVVAVRLASTRSKEPYRILKKIRKQRKLPRPNKGSRAIKNNDNLSLSLYGTQYYSRDP